MQLKFAILGVLLGIIGGIILAIVGTAGIAGFLWLFVYGDNPWPAQASLLIIAPFISILIFSILLGGYSGFRFGRDTVRLSPVEQKHRIKNFYIFFWLVMVTAGLIFGARILAEHSGKNKIQQYKIRQTNTEEFKQSLHQIESIELDPVDIGFNIKFIAKGQRAGAYEVQAYILDHNKIALSCYLGQASLRSGEVTQNIFVDYNALTREFQKHIASGASGAGFQAKYPLVITLKPILSGTEISMLPTKLNFSETQERELTTRKEIQVQVKCSLNNGNVSRCSLSPI